MVWRNALEDRQDRSRPVSAESRVAPGTSEPPGPGAMAASSTEVSADRQE